MRPIHLRKVSKMSEATEQCSKAQKTAHTNSCEAQQIYLFQDMTRHNGFDK